MAQIAVNKTGPKAFILAPDGEFSDFDPQNDQIWALSLDASDACPFYLQTTYQLRASLMRLFPNIFVEKQKITKNGDFSQSPMVTRYTPSALSIAYTVITGIQVRFNCFIPEPGVLVGMVEVLNSGDEALAVGVEMAAILIPMNKGNATQPQIINGTHFLAGQAGELFPVLFMSGGSSATSNPYPALQIQLDLEASQSKALHWVLATQNSLPDSVDTARRYASPDWHKHLQVHTKANEKQLIQISTGQPDWDTAFILAQVNALTHLVNHTSGPYQPTFIANRLTDQPTPVGDGYAGNSNLTLLDTLHLSQVLLPAHSDHLTRLAESFIARVDEQGQLALGHQRGIPSGGIKECPLLATLCLALFEITADMDFLQRVYPDLQRFLSAGWLANTNDGQQRLPTWQSPAQLQLDSGLFNFDIWEETGNGLAIHTAQSPALAAMLTREALSLKKIAHLLGDRSGRNRYAKIIKHLQEKINAQWHEKLNTFCYQDHQTQLTPTREIYYPGRIQTQLKINKRFTQPQRLQVHLTTLDANPRAGSVCIEGENATGERIVEIIQPPVLRWIAKRIHLTTQNVFAALFTIDFVDFNTNDRYLIETANYTQADISCLLPIWSGGIHKEQPALMLANHLDEQPAGIPETWPEQHPLPDGLRPQVNILWNTLIIEGMVREGMVTEAMALFTSMMTTLIGGLKNFNGFYPLFDHQTGVPKGNANAITGMAPLNLCLKIAGIKLFSPERVAIWGENPFPWPIEVRWRGLWLRKEGAVTQIIFPDGRQHHSKTVKPLLVKSTQG